MDRLTESPRCKDIKSQSGNNSARGFSEQFEMKMNYILSKEMQGKRKNMIITNGNRYIHKINTHCFKNSSYISNG